MTDTDIESRLRRMEDIEAIRTLKHRYCAACDDDYNVNQLAVLFTEDAVWDGGALGCFNGRDSIRKFFAASSRVAPFAIHQVSNSIIEIDGDQATGSWYLWEPIVMVRESQPTAMWMAATYSDRYVRVGAEWLFEHVKVNLRMLTPYDEDFVKVRIADL